MKSHSFEKQNKMYRTKETGCSPQQTRNKVHLHQGGNWQEEEEGPGKETDEPVSGYSVMVEYYMVGVFS